MNKRGIDGVLIASTVFEPLATGEALAYGHEGLKILVMPHPFGSLSRREVRRLAERLEPRLTKLVSVR
jgi:hypothetical protein